MAIYQSVEPQVRNQRTTGRWLMNRIEAHPIVAMVTLMYLLAWPKLIASATDSYGLTQLHLSPWLDILTGWAPGIAAFTITALVQGKPGVTELWRKMLRWRVGWGWYAVVFLGSALLILGEGGLYEVAMGNWMALPVAQMATLNAIGSTLVMFVLFAILNTEEIAWRGFVLPRLQSRYGALVASVLLWVPWTLLHLPYFFTKGSVLQQMGPLAFASGTLVLSIIFTWLFNNTKGSVLLCTLLHAALNSWPMLLIPAQSTMPSVVGYASDAAIALLFILIFSAARLARSQDREPFMY